MTNTQKKNSIKIKGQLIIKNDRGLHTRPSTELVKCASNFRSTILLNYQKNCVNAKSLLGILMLCANKGARIKIEAEGEDADQAVRALIELAANHFYTKF